MKKQAGSIVKYMIVILGVVVVGRFTGIFGSDSSVDSALRILHSDPVLILASDRVSTRISISVIQANSLLLGKRETFAVLDVTYLFGMDMEQLTRESIQERNDTLIVHLPEIELIEATPDLGSLELMSSQSGLRWIEEQLVGSEEVTEDLFADIGSIIREPEYVAAVTPSRQIFIARLNSYASSIEEETGMCLRFV